MSTALKLAEKDLGAIEQVLVQGDLSKLSSDQRIVYYNGVCDSLGLNKLTRPFEYITLNGKLTLYARRECTEQLRKMYNVSITITAREKIGDVYVVTAKAKMPDGREDESTGAVALGTLKGDMLANAYLKAETKAKRRVTLSICGLGILDESEVDSVTKEDSKAGKLNSRQSEQAKDVTPMPSLGSYVCQVGKKFKGMELKDIPVGELINFVNWIREECDQPSQSLLEFAENAEQYMETKVGFKNG